jgi:hypothetical protein
MRTIWLLVGGFALVAFLGTAVGCEDVECKAALSLKKSETEKAVKDLEVARKDLVELREKAKKTDDLTAQVAKLQKDLEAAKAAPAAEAPKPAKKAKKAKKR